MGFKTLDIRQQKTEIPKRWKTNKVSPAISPAHYLESLESKTQELESKQSPAESLS